MSALRKRIESDRAELARLYPSGPTAVQLAFRYKVSVAAAAPMIQFAVTNEVEKSNTAWKGGGQKPTKDATLSRFGTAKPEGGADLRADHPALREARTIFPSTVVSPRDTERLLVSGHNNPKLGAEIRKGPWRGFPLYQLTLEERATCPRSCAQWAGCYGNTMHMARRHDHRDGELLALLEMELTALAGQHPFGFAVRLHTLGDFYSVDYVKFWGFMLEALPSLHVFGFTAYRAVADDEGEAAIGAEVEALNVTHPDRSFIRFSGEPGQGGSRVFDHTPARGSADGAGVLMCPAQTGATAACATCGLCWAPAAWPKAIGFLKHGMKTGRKPRAVKKLATEVHFVPKASPAPKTLVRAGPVEPYRPPVAKTPPRSDLVAPPPPQPNYVLHCSTQSDAPIPFAEDRGVVRLARRPAKLGISPEEQDRLIVEALKTKTVTVCPPAFADVSKQKR